MSNLLNPNPKPKAPAAGSTLDLLHQRARIVGAYGYQAAKMHRLEGKATPAELSMLNREEQLTEQINAQDKVDRAQQAQKLEIDKHSANARFQRGGFISDRQLEIEGIPDVALRVNPARRAISEAFTPGSELNKAFMDERHPAHKQTCQEVTNYQRIAHALDASHNEQ